MKRIFNSLLFVFCVVMLLSWATGCNQSINVDAETVDEPGFDPIPGPYNTSQNIYLTHNDPDVTIYYTTNGTNPTTASQKYTTGVPVNVNADTATVTIIKAMATKANYTNSSVVSGRYAIVWKYMPELEVEKAYFGCASTGGKIYLAGGSSDEFVEYDPANGVQILRPSIPTERDDLACINVNDSLYILGGSGTDPDTGASITLNTIDKNDDPSSASATWDSLDNTGSAQRYGHAAAAYNGIVYVFGGNGGGVYLDTAQKFSAGAWSSSGTISSPLTYLYASVCNGKIYVTGGMPVSGFNVTTVEEFDPASGLWTPRTSMLHGRCMHGTAAVNNKLYAIGGSGVDPGEIANVEEFDPAVGTNGTWTEKTPMPVERRGFGIAEVDGKIYILGGYTGSTLLKTVLCYDPANDY